MNHVTLIDQGVRLPRLSIVNFLRAHRPVIVHAPESIDGVLIAILIHVLVRATGGVQSLVVINITGTHSEVEIPDRHEV